MFEWLFGKHSPVIVENAPQRPSSPQWEPSESGNPMMIYRDRRLTVFPADSGWKFCIAKMEDESPYFSEVYRTEQAAKYEALALVEGRPSQHATRRDENTVVQVMLFLDLRSVIWIAGWP